MFRTIIIAEAGVNHNGNLQLAEQLIEAAARAGADFVKFQTFRAANLVTASAEKAAYQKANEGSMAGESQLQMLAKLELNKEAHLHLIEHCKKHNIKFLSTAFDLESIDLLNELGIELFKIPSGEITNLPLLRKIAGSGKPVILSTGMATIEEIGDAIDVLKQNGIPTDLITVLHCTTEYPAPLEEVNLKAMHSIGETFKVKTGYSDHTKGIVIPIAATALGATIIEKHFTISRGLPGPDHKASLEPDELAAMVAAIRNVEKALGSGIKEPSVSELKNRVAARKSIHLSKNLTAGHALTNEDMVMKRPGDGISPMLLDTIIGKKLKTDLKADTQLKPEHLL